MAVRWHRRVAALDERTRREEAVAAGRVDDETVAAHDGLLCSIMMLLSITLLREELVLSSSLLAFFVRIGGFASLKTVFRSCPTPIPAHAFQLHCLACYGSTATLKKAPEAISNTDRVELRAKDM